MGKLKIRNEDGVFVDAPAFQGADGKDPYIFAVESGYTGTEQQFYTDLASLSGVETVLAAM